MSGLGSDEAQLRAVLETAVDSIITIDGGGTIQSVNPATVRLFGYAPTELIGQNVKMLMPAPYRDEHDAYLARYLKTGEKRIIGLGREVQARRKDGSIFPVDLAVSEVESGRLFTGIIRDLSERRDVETRLRESEQRFGALIKAASEVVYRMNSDWTVMQQLEGRNFISDTLEPDETWLNRYIHPDDQALVWSAIERAIREKCIFELEHRVIRVDGSPGWVHSRAIPILNGRNEVIQWFGAACDITARKQSEETLRQSEARLRAVLETAVDSIITIDERGHIRSVNPATTRMFGYPAAEMVGQNITMLMPSPYREEHDGYLARYAKTGEQRIIGIGREVQAQRKDGTVFSIDLGVSEVEQGRLFTGIIRDLSERKLAELRLRQTDRMASIGTLAAGLGHDMNNVLLPVRAHLNALKASVEADSTGLEHLEQIQSGVSYLQQLADGLHFLAMDPEKEGDTGGVTDLRAWWAQTGPLLRNAVPKHVTVTTSLADDLPAIALATHALTQIVLNLIVNAGEAVQAAGTGRQTAVRLVAERGPDQNSVKLSISDTGTGMTDEVKRRAFDMFFTTKPRGLGTGLGLAMVRSAVDRAGGTIEIESTLGRGTTITLMLPVAISSRKEHTSACVRVRDGRVASLIQHLLEASGARADGSAPEADVWIVEPTATNLTATKAWRTAQPRGRVVLVGRPSEDSTRAWNELAPVIIDDPTDLEAVRSAMNTAMSYVV